MMNVLSIAGSDPSSGAGIQADIKTFLSLGVYGLTVITSITSQNTSTFSRVESVSPLMIKSQIDSIISDFRINAIKVGMVYNTKTIQAIFSKLKKTKIPIILDPVIKSTTGGDLLEKSSLTSYKKLLIPLAYTITPNVSEAEKLSGIKIKTKKDLLNSARKIQKFGAKNVVITGTEFEKGQIADFVVEDSVNYFVNGKKISKINHGSGCNFSSALTVAVAKGNNLEDAVKFAKDYALHSIKNSKKIGKGLLVSNPATIVETEEKILSGAIIQLQKMSKSYTLIPECQTNFVFAKKNPVTKNDILGVEGRIVKAGRSLVMAGNLKYGGSKHVANAVLETSKKFPKIRSALNVKYEQKIIQKAKKKGLIVLSYNRADEPDSSKQKENSTISWGIKNAIKNSKKPPDLIFHKGDVGKEPMILIFGQNPDVVLKKIKKIL